MKQFIHYFNENDMYHMTKAVQKVLIANPTWELEIFELMKTDKGYESMAVYRVEYKYSIRKGVEL
jgi:hypothetical protein